MNRGELQNPKSSQSWVIVRKKSKNHSFMPSSPAHLLVSSETRAMGMQHAKSELSRSWTACTHWKTKEFDKSTSIHSLFKTTCPKILIKQWRASEESVQICFTANLPIYLDLQSLGLIFCSVPDILCASGKSHGCRVYWFHPHGDRETSFMRDQENTRMKPCEAFSQGSNERHRGAHTSEPSILIHCH